MSNSTIKQIRRGTAAQHETFIGAEGEITMDTTNKTLRVHDGVTPGGTILARQIDIPAPVITEIQKQQNGYIKFENGLIIQWGRIPEVTNTGKQVTFPTPFTATTYGISGNNPTITYGNLQLNSFEATRTSSGTTTGVRWIAVGY